MDQARIDLIINRTDENGTRLNYNSSTGELSLQQPNEDRWRIIGKIIQKDDTFIYYKREKEADKYRKYKAWSVYYILLDIVDIIHYETELMNYVIEVKTLKTMGFKTWDKGVGSSAKIVCPIRYWDLAPKSKRAKNLIEKLGYEWFDELHEVFAGEEMVQLSRYLREARKRGVSPESDVVFTPFRACQFLDVSIVMIDTHPRDKGRGLAFSTHDSYADKYEPLEVLLDIKEDEIYDGMDLNRTKNLEDFAQQGALLIPDIYTRNFYGERAHQDIGWEFFNREVLKRLSNRGGVIFLLFGDIVQENYRDVIDRTTNLVLEVPYPTRDNEKEIRELNIFKQCNKYREEISQKTIW
ncbi:hypothetical protein PP178_04030 [Zeaxanthinibacter sp. PT1]|uniref:hypothetical protein n=1 Tax=Zeaxanthinibacter TaxID=561554 RepID=UPI0023497A52|nr:hypothetical protein [Zeaxanthinibacter sp. PT1]MDC6350709.1 hypothetical protein [Zeaxanthinibacter sp. PT1]